MSPRWVGGWLGSRGGRGPGAGGAKSTPGSTAFQGQVRFHRGHRPGQDMPSLLSLTPWATPAESPATLPTQGPACQTTLTGHPGWWTCLLTAFLADSFQGLKHRLLDTNVKQAPLRKRAWGLGAPRGPSFNQQHCLLILGPTTSEQQRASTGGRLCVLPPTSREGRELQDTATGHEGLKEAQAIHRGRQTTEKYSSTPSQVSRGV